METELWLRPFRDSDLYLFRKWLEKPYVLRWFQNTDAWLYEVTRRNDEFHWIHHYIAETADRIPIGFCQYYDYANGGETWHGDLDIQHTCSIDYMIGEEAYLGKKLSTTMISGLEAELRKDSFEKIIVQPDKDNRISRKALFRAAYQYDGRRDLFYKLL